MPDLEMLITKLAEAKAEEDAAKRRRAEIEEQLARAIGVPETWTGSTTSDICGYKVTCTRRDNVRIDADRLLNIMDESPELETWSDKVFRWRPEIAKKEWDAAPADVIKALSAVITRTPGKVSFTLKNKTQEA